MLIEGADYFVRFMDMPDGIFAFVTPNDDGTFSIYLDPRRSSEQLAADYRHEVKHIANGDFYNGKPLQEVEK